MKIKLNLAELFQHQLDATKTNFVIDRFCNNYGSDFTLI